MGEEVGGVVGVEDIEGQRCCLNFILLEKLAELGKFLDVSAMPDLDVVVEEEVVMGIESRAGTDESLEALIMLEVAGVPDGQLLLDNVAVVHNDVI